MGTKELKIQAPEGCEIDKENSTFECIRFKPIKKNITYDNVCNAIFKNKTSYYINNVGRIVDITLEMQLYDKNNATNRKQLERLLALNQLLNIAEYYNRLHTKLYNMIDKQYVISYDEGVHEYIIKPISPCYRHGIEAVFNRAGDAQAVIDNPNFREILYTIYIQ